MAASFEIDPNLSFKEILDGLHEWSISEFGVPIGFDLFNKRILRDYESLKDELSRTPEWEGNENDIRRYIDANLLPPLVLQDGSPGFPLYASMRCIFLKQLEKKWSYDITQLKCFSDYEESLIDSVYAGEELDYSDLPILDFFIAYLDEQITLAKENLNHCIKDEDKNFYLARVKKNENEINYLEGKSFEELSSNLQKKIGKDVFMIKWHYELSRIEGIKFNQAQMLCGFSPNVTVKRSEARAIKGSSSGDINFIRSEYPYYYEDHNYNKIYLFGDWTFYDPATCLGFFSTPDFLIDKIGDKIIVEIRNPANVDSKYMPRIEKIYVEYRQSLNPPKVAWGEKKGTKAMLRKRDKRLKEIYWQLRRDKPQSASEHHLRFAVKKVALEFGDEISVETAKRIIYSKKDITNSSATK